MLPLAPFPDACGSSAAPLASKPRRALASPSAFPNADEESCPAGIAASAVVAVIAAQAAVQTTAPAHRTPPRHHLFLYFMEFPSSLNKAKPTGLWQIECPDIDCPHSKIVFIEGKSKHWIIGMFSEPACGMCRNPRGQAQDFHCHGPIQTSHLKMWATRFETARMRSLPRSAGCRTIHTSWSNSLICGSIQTRSLVVSPASCASTPRPEPPRPPSNTPST